MPRNLGTGFFTIGIQIPLSSFHTPKKGKMLSNFDTEIGDTIFDRIITGDFSEEDNLKEE